MYDMIVPCIPVLMEMESLIWNINAELGKSYYVVDMFNVLCCGKLWNIQVNF